MVMIVENALMNLLLSKLLGGHYYLSRQVIILKYKQKVGVPNLDFVSLLLPFFLF